MGDPRPLGIPVSRAILLPPGPLGNELRPGIEAIDRVHGDGPLPQLPVMPDPTLEAEAAFEVIRATGEPYRFVVNPTGRQVALSLVHEVAHFLMHADKGVSRVPPTFHDPLFGSWRTALEQSERIATLRDLARQTSNADLFARLRHELDFTELWARSYAQFIALRSDDRALQGHVRERRLGMVGGLPIPIQWGGTDFEPVANAIDELMRGLGWIG